MIEPWYARIAFPFVYAWNHYIIRRCSCHKWPWQEWSAR